MSTISYHHQCLSSRLLWRIICFSCQHLYSAPHKHVVVLFFVAVFSSTQRHSLCVYTIHSCPLHMSRLIRFPSYKRRLSIQLEFPLALLLPKKAIPFLSLLARHVDCPIVAVEPRALNWPVLFLSSRSPSTHGSSRAWHMFHCFTGLFLILTFSQRIIKISVGTS